MAYRVVLISMSDLDRLPLGGEVRLMHNFLIEKKPDDMEFSLAGMSFSPDAPAGEWTETVIGGIRYPFFPLCQVLKPKEKTKIPFRIRVVQGLRRYYKKAGIDGFDAVYVQTPELILPLTGYKGRVILHIHSDIFQTLGVSRFPIFRLKIFTEMYTGYIRRGLRRADAIIWSADTIRRTYFESRPDMGRILKDRSVVIHSCYDPELVPGDKAPVPSDDREYFITVGRLAKGKRIDFVIDAFASFCKAHEDGKYGLIVCGDGEVRSELEAQAAGLGIGDSVIFTGNLDRPALAACLSQSRMFLFASVSETMSLVVIESLYMGVPVVSSDVGDLHLAVKDDDTGYMVRDFSRENYVAAMEKIIAVPAEVWKERCERMAAEFSPARMNDAVCDLIRRTCVDTIQRVTL